MNRNPPFAISAAFVLSLVAASVGCSSDPASDPAPAASASALSGRYGPFPDAPSVWFSGDGRGTYRLLPGDAKAGVEEGTYTFEGDRLTLRSSDGAKKHEYRATVAKRLRDVAEPSATTKLASLRPATSSAPCSAFEPTSDTNVEPPSVASGDEGAPSDEGTSLLRCSGVTLIAALADAAASLKVNQGSSPPLDTSRLGGAPPVQVAAVTACQAAWSRAALQCGSTLCSVVGCILHQIDPEYCAGILPGLPACVTAVQNAMAVCRSPSCG